MKVKKKTLGKPRLGKARETFVINILGDNSPSPGGSGVELPSQEGGFISIPGVS